MNSASPFSPEQVDELLLFFKAMADVTRLKIIGLLANQAYTGEQLSDLLGLSPSTISHHLARLKDAGLVSARAEQYYAVYTLNSARLEQTARVLLEKNSLHELAREVDLDAYDRKVLKTFLTPEGRVRQIPAQHKKQEVVNRYLAAQFEFGREYTEKEVNEILARFHEDTAWFRRALIDNHLMARKDGRYWRI